MSGRCKDRPELAERPIPLTAQIDVLPVRGDSGFVNRLFEPLGYSVRAVRHALDEEFPGWGESPYYSVTLNADVTLAELLTHLYVLIPVFDNSKHYYVGDDELEKLLAKGALSPIRRTDGLTSSDASERGVSGPSNPAKAGWLGRHPEKESITRRYLRHRPSLFRQALARLVDNERDTDGGTTETDAQEDNLERQLSLNEQRHGTVIATLRASGARSVVDLGCGEGKLLRELLSDQQFERITGVDVSIRALEMAQKRLKLDRLPDRQTERLRLIHGSLMYRDERFAGFDAAAVVEVIEHLDPPRLAAFERVLFEFARPKTIVLTTPNQEYNSKWETLPAGQFRHSDHRFEWTRQQFQDWASRVARQHSYSIRFLPVGPEDEQVGSPTQMGVFERMKPEE